MSIGAVITAAGMSSRMGDFKQLMKLGTYSLIEHIILKFQHAGINDIVVVTGYKESAVREALSAYDVNFVHNYKYETSQMFDSVKLGLEFIKDKVDRVFFCPCDVASFRIDTVTEIKKTEGSLVVPSYKGRTGHPICMDTSIIDDILSYKGENGLRGAIKSVGVKIINVDVEDFEIMRDIDTIKDYERLKELYEGKE